VFFVPFVVKLSLFIPPDSGRQPPDYRLRSPARAAIFIVHHSSLIISLPPPVLFQSEIAIADFSRTRYYRRSLAPPGVMENGAEWPIRGLMRTDSSCRNRLPRTRALAERAIRGCAPNQRADIVLGAEEFQRFRIPRSASAALRGREPRGIPKWVGRTRSLTDRDGPVALRSVRGF
jgi:hypothetical protein